MFFRWHIFTPHLRWEVKALLAPQDGKGETEVEGGVHDVHVLVESHQVLLPVVLEAHQHHVGAQLAKTGQSHARLGTAHKVGGLCNVLGSKSTVWFPFNHLGARVVALDVVVPQPPLHPVLQVGHVHLQEGMKEKATKYVRGLLCVSPVLLPWWRARRWGWRSS